MLGYRRIALTRSLNQDRRLASRKSPATRLEGMKFTHPVALQNSLKPPLARLQVKVGGITMREGGRAIAHLYEEFAHLLSGLFNGEHSIGVRNSLPASTGRMYSGRLVGACRSKILPRRQPDWFKRDLRVMIFSCHVALTMMPEQIPGLLSFWCLPVQTQECK